MLQEISGHNKLVQLLTHRDHYFVRKIFVGIGDGSLHLTFPNLNMPKTAINFAVVQDTSTDKLILTSHLLVFQPHSKQYIWQIVTNT